MKRTLYFGNPVWVGLRNAQLVIRVKDPENGEVVREKTVPIEDIGMVVVDHREAVITQGAMSALAEQEAAVVVCDRRSMPVGLMLPIEGHSTQSERYRAQLEASLPLKKQMWQQTVSRKIGNQAALLGSRGVENGCMLRWMNEVRSGDPDNLEARAAAYYWRNIMGEGIGIVRDREGEMPNAFFNYGYAIVRAAVARGLVVSGLLPTLGIHHRNKYNAYCLADDIMEPYRPYVDKAALAIYARVGDIAELTTAVKAELLSVLQTDVRIGGKTSPLGVAIGQTTASVWKCYAGETRKILYPEMEV